LLRRAMAIDYLLQLLTFPLVQAQWLGG